MKFAAFNESSGIISPYGVVKNPKKNSNMAWKTHRPTPNITIEFAWPDVSNGREFRRWAGVGAFHVRLSRLVTESAVPDLRLVSVRSGSPSFISLAMRGGVAVPTSTSR